MKFLAKSWEQDKLICERWELL